MSLLSGSLTVGTNWGMNEGRGEFWSKYREKVIVYEYNRVIVSIYLRRCDLRGYFLCRASVETVRRRGVAARLWQEGERRRSPDNGARLGTQPGLVGVNTAAQY